jgi:hypothetical protein
MISNKKDTLPLWRLGLLVAITLFALVTIFGKGGGDPPAEGGSSNWDQMVWDQDDWA